MTIPPIDAFIERWNAAGGSERANYQLFLTELCALLELPTPDPASDDTRDNAFMFERRGRLRHGDCGESHGFIDLYLRGCFVCEAKQTARASKPKAGTRPCCAPAARPNPTPAPCPPTKAARRC